MEEGRFPPSFQISRQLDQEKINFLTRRVEELVQSNNDLRISSGQNEKDTHDIVIYFQREMEIKDDVIMKLNEELVKCQTQLKFEVEKVRKTFEEELTEIRTTSESTITSLSEKLETCESELKAVYAFKKAKDQHEGTIARLEKNLQQQREQLIDAMEEQERRFLEEKAALFKDLDEQKAAFREVALKEARSAMGEEAKKILADNNRMFEELKFHHNEAADMQAEKSQLVVNLTTAKRDINIFADKEVEYAKQAHMRTKEIKALRERVEQLEKQQSENLERFKVRTKELKTSVSKELQEATLDAAGLRRLIQIKNKELRQMKSLAATILGQRTETEQFFLEALQEVKEVIRKERHRNQQETRRALNKLKSGAGVLAATAGPTTNPELDLLMGRTAPTLNNNGGAMFPPLNVKGANLHLIEPRKPSDLPLADIQKLSIKDLSWEDKELVLRVLFAKMNGVAGGTSQATNQVHGNNNNSAKYRTQEPMPMPVFLSEGADMPTSAGAAQYQVNFEINRDDSNSPPRVRSASYNNSRGAKSNTNTKSSSDDYNFEDIGGGSLHSSHFGTSLGTNTVANSRSNASYGNNNRGGGGNQYRGGAGMAQIADGDEGSLVASSIGSMSR
uniref:Coiled-coil domain-containing protein 176 n=1 Tax=Spumella elongata TaxID=89044 RepID=A0A7S3M0U4_9STRA|mmetsp:Transcript_17616/g.30662  ORF Transcript_17616/g.30662 Transcript_17616/m.30662 type:complete len:620 (+) Transcript_17616:50-1909(+)